MASYNRGFAIVGVQYILLAFVLNQSLGIFMNFGAKTPHHRKAPYRWASVWWSEKTHVKTIQLKKELWQLLKEI